MFLKIKLIFYIIRTLYAVLLNPNCNTVGIEVVIEVVKKEKLFVVHLLSEPLLADKVNASLAALKMIIHI